MRNDTRIAVLIPAYNEAEAIAKVIDAIPSWVDRVIVCDNASTDDTAAVAADHGAHVVHEPTAGYGAACLKAMEALEGEEVIVFLDGDYSDYPEDMADLVDPILRGDVDFVVGSRRLGEMEPGALTPQQRWGNGLACGLIRLFWAERYTDLGPFRAIRYSTLTKLNMQDRTWGWTVEMQVRAAKLRVPTKEVPVRYRRRIGVSKISGTVSGVIRAGTKILFTIGREALGFNSKSTTKVQLILFSKYPVAGMSKTRLIPAVGPEEAAELHRAMATRAAFTLRRFRLDGAGDVSIRFTGADTAAMADWLGPDLEYVEQGEGDLGERMARAVDEGLRTHEGVLLMGTDCPQLDERIAAHAAALLDTNDVVVGPAHDGGYYLIGMKQLHPELLTDIEWGTSTVFEATQSRIESLGLRAAYLRPLHDIDRPEDLVHWKSRESQPAPNLSVLIPTLNEAMCIGDAIAAATRSDAIEVIVSDGGSSDDTIDLARNFGATVVTGGQGRGAQLNLGVAEAQAEAMLFLHADTVLPPGYSDEITEALQNSQLGAFRLGIDGDGVVIRLAERIANFRSRFAKLPYGDQALFVRRDAFEPFPEIPVMEDFAWVRSMSKRGDVSILRGRVRTSGRRWKRFGAIRLTLLHQLLIIGFFLGVSPERLARWRGRSD